VGSLIHRHNTGELSRGNDVYEWAGSDLLRFGGVGVLVVDFIWNCFCAHV